MLYEEPVRDDEGYYFVRAKTDENKKCLIQLNNIMVQNSEDTVSLRIAGKRHSKKIDPIDEENLKNAVEKSKEWFKKEVSEETLKKFYVPSVDENILSADKIKASKIFNAQNEQIEMSDLTEEKKCNTLVEFAGIWFAKKSFGPIWNIVQVKVLPEPEVKKELEPEFPVEPEYPEEYALNDEISEDEEEE